jgi:hypothetical protein
MTENVALRSIELIDMRAYLRDLVFKIQMKRQSNCNYLGQHEGKTFVKQIDLDAFNEKEFIDTIVEEFKDYPLGSGSLEMGNHRNHKMATMEYKWNNT